MSILNKKDYFIDSKRATGRVDNRIVMKKQKIPTNMKTVLSICPMCSKKGYDKKKKQCKICKFKFRPNRSISWEKSSLS